MVGVQHLVDGAPVLTRAGRGVVMTAGAIDTPRLLMLSGIGDAAALSALGIRPRVDLPGVGANYQDHPLIEGVTARAREPLGPVRDNGGGAMLNWRSTLAGPAPDLHAFVVQGPHATAEVRSDYDLSGDVFAVVAGAHGFAQHRARAAAFGGSRIVAPDIQPNFLAEQHDLDALVESLDTIQDLFGTRAFADLIDAPLAPPGRLPRREAERYIRRSVSTFFHACGTARIGIGRRRPRHPRARAPRRRGRVDRGCLGHADDSDVQHSRPGLRDRRARRRAARRAHPHPLSLTCTEPTVARASRSLSLTVAEPVEATRPTPPEPPPDASANVDP